MAEFGDEPPITKCPPGTAKNAILNHWQFGLNNPFGIAGYGNAQRIAGGDLKPCEAAVFETVINRTGDLSQHELESILLTQMGATMYQVHNAAQCLAKLGKIGRKKISGRWHYAKPGFSWRKDASNPSKTSSPSTQP